VFYVKASCVIAMTPVSSVLCTVIKKSTDMFYAF
jgi:hypothetical protein